MEELRKLLSDNILYSKITVDDLTFAVLDLLNNKGYMSPEMVRGLVFELQARKCSQCPKNEQGGEMTEEELKSKLFFKVRKAIYRWQDNEPTDVISREVADQIIDLIKEAGYKNCNQCDATNVKKEGPPMDVPLGTPYS